MPFASFLALLPSPSMRLASSTLASALLLATTLGVAASASAQVRSARAHDDGVWGRFGSDLVFSVGADAGASLGDPAVNARGGDEPAFALDVELRLRVLDSAGIVLRPEWRPEGASRFGVALDVRPVFLTRFLFGGSTDDRYWDLFLDSIGVDLGIATLAPAGRVGFAWVLGLGLDVPLYVPEEVTGALALRLSARYSAASARDAWSPGVGLDEWTIAAGLLVRFHANVGIASWEPTRYRVASPE